MSKVRCQRCRAWIEEVVVTESNPLKLRAYGRRLAFHLADSRTVCRRCLRDIGAELCPKPAAAEKPIPPIPDYLPPDGLVWRRCEKVRPSALDKWRGEASWAIQRQMQPFPKPEPCFMPRLVRRDDYDVRCDMTPRCHGLVNPKPEKDATMPTMTAPVARRR